MGRITNLQIQFDQPNPVIYSGETLKGTVKICCSGPVTYKKISIKLFGEGHAEWKKTGHFVIIPNLKQSEVYLDKTLVLSQSGSFEEGTTNLSFSDTLPAGLPSSFQGLWGYVRYSATAAVVMDKSKVTEQNTAIFKVVQHLDLNRIPKSADPITINESRSISSLFCLGSGKVSVEIRVNRRGFVEGEEIQIEADILNNSQQIMKMKAGFRQVTIYNVNDGPSNAVTTIRNIMSRKTEQIQARSDHRWRNVSMKVPPLVPTRLFGCRIIQIFHKLRFTLSAKGSRDISVEKDIAIGTIPLRSTQEESSLPPYDDFVYEMEAPPPYESVGFSAPESPFEGPSSGMEYVIAPPAYSEQDPSASAACAESLLGANEEDEVTHL